MDKLYEVKQPQYYSQIRKDLVSIIQGKDLFIAEVGAARCDTLVYLKETKVAKYVCGMDLMRFENTNQDNPLIDKLIIGKVEELNSDELNEKFDYLILGDVLEHLYDPWEILEKLKSLLKPGGIVIISVPNIRFIQTFVRIFLKGSFKYDSFGLFDKTHIRFFCKKDILKLVIDTSFQVQNVYPILKFENKFSILNIVNFLSFGIFEEFLSLQYIVVAKK